MLVTDYLTLNAWKYGQEDAIIYINLDGVRKCLTWDELNKYANLIANMLMTKGIDKGDKIAILLPNSLCWLPIYFGILKLGAVVVPLNYRNSVEDICYSVKLAECKGIFLAETNIYYEVYETRLKKCFLFKVKDDVEFGDNALLEGEYRNIEPTLSSNDVAAVYFSSGTTGKAKAVLISHGALLSAAEIELTHHGQVHSDRFLCLTPLYHTGAKIHWFGSFLVGGAIVIFDSSSPMSIIKVVEKEKITIVWLLVPQIQDILDAIDSGDINKENIDISSLRLMHSGAQHVPKTLIQRWHNRFPNLLYDTSYGLTEATGPGCIHLGINNIDKAGSIGHPDPNWSVNIVDEHGISVEKGTVGELIIQGPGVMLEYYKDEEATNNALKNGWLYTGDLAYVDDDGFIYIVDRKKDVIICGGENIYPIQIENHIRLLEGIKDVAVIGMSNKRLGEVVIAVIELDANSTCSKSEVYKHCKKLPEYQRPMRIYFYSVLRNGTGKIDKKNIRKMIEHT